MKQIFNIFLKIIITGFFVLASIVFIIETVTADNSGLNQTKISSNIGDGVGILENTIINLLTEKILDKRLSLELNFSSSSKVDYIQSRMDNIKDITLETLEPKFSNFRVKIFYNDGQIETLSGKYIAYIEVPIAAKYIKFGDIISSDDIGYVRMRIDKIQRGFATENAEIIGLKAKKQISPNSMFRLNDLINPPVIKANDPVNIIYNSGNINLKTTGTALGSGAVGDTIKIKNDSSGAVLLGEIVNKNTVNVGGK